MDLEHGSIATIKSWVGICLPCLPGFFHSLHCLTALLELLELFTKIIVQNNDTDVAIM